MWSMNIENRISTNPLSKKNLLLLEWFGRVVDVVDAHNVKRSFQPFLEMPIRCCTYKNIKSQILFRKW